MRMKLVELRKKKKDTVYLNERELSHGILFIL